MGRHYFTDEEMEILRQSPYVEKVTRANVMFSVEMKERMYSLLEAGYSPKEALNELGIDYAILGKKRSCTLGARLRQQAHRQDRFERMKKSRRKEQ